MSLLPLRRSSSLPLQCRLVSHSQIRHATLLRRPKRPYTFTQLVTLSDGSCFTHRTTSPVSVHKSTKDTRNTVLWNPSSRKLLSVEADEAGKLRAFREKFGRGWDAERMDSEEEGEKEENLMDLISESGSGKEEGEGNKEKEKKGKWGKG